MAPDGFRAELYQDPKFRDLILICEGRKFSAHQAIVCRDSAWIEQLTTSAPRDSDRRIVVIENCDALTLHRVIKFLYMGHYESDDEDIELPQGSPNFQSRPRPASHVWALLELAESANDGFDLLQPLQPSTLLDGLIDTFTPFTPALPSSNNALIDVAESPSLLTRVVNIEAAFCKINKTPQIARAWNHLKVYNAAQHFNIIDLSHEALARLTDQLHDSWSSEGFADLVHFAFEIFRQATEASPPCHLISAECAKNIMRLLEDAHFDHILRNNAHLAYLIIHRLVETARDNQDNIISRSTLHEDCEHTETSDHCFEAAGSDDEGSVKSFQPLSHDTLVDETLPFTENCPDQESQHLWPTMPKGSSSHFTFIPNNEGADIQAVFTRAMRSQTHRAEDKRSTAPVDSGNDIDSVTAGVEALVLDPKIHMNSCTQQAGTSPSVRKGRGSFTLDRTSFDELKYTEQQEMIQSLLATTSTHEETIQRLEALSTENQNLIDSLTSTVTAKESELSGLHGQLSKADDEISDLQRGADTQKRKLEQKDVELETASKRICELEANLCAVRDRLAQTETRTGGSIDPELLAQSMAAARAEKEAELGLQKMSERMRLLQAKFDDSEKEIEVLVAEKAILWEKIQKTTVNDPQLAKRYTEVSNRCSSLTKTNADLAQDNAILAKKNKVLAAEFDEIREDNDDLKNEVENQKEQLKNLYPVMKELKLSRAKSKHWEVMGENASLSEDNGYLTTKVQNQRHQLSSLLPKMENLKQQAKEITRLQNELKICNEELRTKSAAATKFADQIRANSEIEATRAAASRERIMELERQLDAYAKNKRAIGPLEFGSAGARTSHALSLNATSPDKIDTVIHSASTPSNGKTVADSIQAAPSVNAPIEKDVPSASPETMPPLTFFQKQKQVTGSDNAPRVNVAAHAAPGLRATGLLPTPPQRTVNVIVPTGPKLPHAPPTPAQSPHSNGVTSPATSAAMIKVEKALRAIPPTAPLPTAQSSSRQEIDHLKFLLAERDKRISFLQTTLTRVRMQDTRHAPSRSFPAHVSHGASNGDAIRRFYNEALRFAGQDVPACTSCHIGFHSQFRGAPEDGSNTLILKCKKCDAEQHRWRM